MAASMSVPFTVSGLPLGEIVGSAIRQVRAGQAERYAELAAEPTGPHAVAAVVVVAAPACPRLAALLRGYSLLALRDDVLRIAADAASQREHIEGLAAGRHYGDPLLRGLLPGDFARRYLPEVEARAERAGALADLLLHLVGHEAELERALDLTLMEGAGV